MALLLIEVALHIFPILPEDRMKKIQKDTRFDSEFVFYEYDRTLGWKNKPFAEGPFVMPESKTCVKINSKGLRDNEYPFERDKDTFRVLVLGDSFTWGIGVNIEETFTKRWEAKYHGRVEIINAGVTG